MSDDPRFLAGIEYFNRRAYFSAHEIWEDVWKETDGPDREFYKGLIQVAVALHHLTNGNWRGACNLFVRCQQLLSPFQPRHEGVELDDLLAALRGCFAAVVPPQTITDRPQLDLRHLPTLRPSPQ